MKRYLIFCFTFILSIHLFSQIVNIESQRIHSDTTGWDGTLEAGFAVNQNNNLLISATTNAHVQYKTRKDLFKKVMNIEKKDKTKLVT